jgi:hypothetical protein
MKLLIQLSFILLFSYSAMAQMPSRSHVKQDENVERLIDAFRQSNKTDGMQGFRVQIYTASGNRSKLLTDREKATFDNTFPDVRSYITYDEPYFKLRVGDFRTRLDAEKFLREISSRYIYSIIVADRINLPLLTPSDSAGNLTE